MSLDLSRIHDARKQLKAEFDNSEEKRAVLRSEIMKELYKGIADVEDFQKAEYGQAVNKLKEEIVGWVEDWEESKAVQDVTPIDITAPFDVNTPHSEKPSLLRSNQGSFHPIVEELNMISDIFVRMGFKIVESRQIDDDYHMFGALNFPTGHPARDDYDTFLTDEDLVLPAHTSTMQNRVLKKSKLPIRTVIPGRVFRNEDLDAYHEHTFYQVEGLVVDKGITLGDMLGTLSTFLESYFNEKIEYKTQPFYFPFVEPGLEFLIKVPKVLQKGGSDEWMEIMGCGMIHPNVLSEGNVDPEIYQGFAWGMGVERLIMSKYQIEDIRHLEAGKLDFLKQFKGSR